jgi:hypothetical protein
MSGSNTIASVSIRKERFHELVNIPEEVDGRCSLPTNYIDVVLRTGLNA